MKLTSESIEQLKERGLLVFEGVTHDSRYTCSVLKPTSAAGNSHPEVEHWAWDENDNEIETNAPTLNIFSTSNGFEIVLSEYMPGPGPSDFRETFTSETGVIKFVLNYYFDPQNEKFNLWYTNR